MNIKGSSSTVVDRKQKRKEIQIHKSRLIVRNLSFKATEDDLRKVFASYGNVVDVNLPKKEDGKSKGFAFISYDNIGSSLKAIKNLNNKKILKRVVAIDFSLPKKAYTEMTSSGGGGKGAKNAADDDNKTTNDNEEDDDEEEKNVEDDPEDVDADNDEKDSENVHDDEDEDEDDNDDDDDDDDDDNEDDFDEDDDEENEQSKKYRKPSDVLEEKTLFIRNVDLETSEESLQQLFSSFGPIEYCKICIDHYTERSKGTAFVKYKNKQDAAKCLEEATTATAAGDNAKFYIDGKQLLVTLALPRNKLIDLENAKHAKHKDKRNLYLAKEGLIYPNSPAAVGVSQADLKKRLQLEEKKRHLLQNYHYFISDRRLCIHNLPPTMDDNKLKQLFLTAAKDKKATIVWAKVMRNRSKVDNKFGNSKGFAFVEFSEHIHALQALRHLNNNPTIYTADKRPIVEFSVENRVALNRKKYRLIKQQKMHQNGDNNSNNDGTRFNNIATTLSDADQEQPATYSGVLSRPLTNTDKVIQPKINKKIRQVKSELKHRNKVIKNEQKKQENLQKHHLKVAIKKAKKSSTAADTRRGTAAEQEEEIFDSHYRKRKHLFVSSSNNGTTTTQINKKSKWFS